MCLRLLSFAGLLFALAACSGLPRNVVVLLPDENGEVGKVIVTDTGGATSLDRPLAAVEIPAGKKPGSSFVAKQDDISDNFAGALAATPRAPVIYILYFITGLTELTPTHKTISAPQSRRLKPRPISTSASSDTRMPPDRKPGTWSYRSTERKSCEMRSSRRVFRRNRSNSRITDPKSARSGG